MSAKLPGFLRRIAAYFGYRDGRDYVSGGAGTTASPYTGWESGIAAESHIRLGAGVWGTAGLDILDKKGVKLTGRGPGATVLKYTGSVGGTVLKVRSAGTDNDVMPFRCEVSGLTIDGMGSAATGLLLSHAHHGAVRDVRVRNVTTTGLRLEWADGWDIDGFHVWSGAGDDDGAAVVQPQYGIVLEDDGAGRYTTTCLIRNHRLANCSVAGIYALHAFACQVFGGFHEGGGGVGILAHSASFNNIFANVDLEGNAGGDIEDGGTQNVWLNCRGDGTLTITSFARMAQVIGGRTHTLAVQSGAKQTLLDGCRYYPGLFTNADATTVIRNLASDDSTSAADNNGTLTPYATSGAATLSADLPYTASSGTYADVLTVTLPTAGTYDVGYDADVDHTASGGSTAFTTLRLYDSTNSAAVPNSRCYPTFEFNGAGLSNAVHLAGRSRRATITVTGATTIKLQASRDTDGTFSASNVRGGNTTLWYRRVGSP